MPGRSQAESEATAKVYQLDALDTKVDNVLKMLDEVLTQTKGVATTVYVNGAIAEARKEVGEYVREEVKKIHLEYRPSKERSDSNRKAIFVVAASLVGQLILSAWLWLQSRLSS